MAVPNEPGSGDVRTHAIGANQIRINTENIRRGGPLVDPKRGCYPLVRALTLG